MNINIRLKEIYFKIAARSKYFRENFAEIESAINNLQWQINQGVIPSGASEVVNARNYADTLSDRLDNVLALMPNAVIEGGEVVESPVPDMGLMVYATMAIINGIIVKRGFGSWERVTTTITITEVAHGLTTGDKIYCQALTGSGAIPEDEYTVTVVDADTFEITGVDAGDTTGLIKFARFSGTITAPVSQTRLDRVVISSDNSISISAGTADTNPVFNDVADTDLCLAGLVVKSTTTSMRDNYEIFQFSGITTDNPDAYITTLVYARAWHFNNLIIDDAVTVSPRSVNPTTPQLKLFVENGESFLLFKCDGYYHESLTVSWTNSGAKGVSNGVDGEDQPTASITATNGGVYGYRIQVGYYGSLIAGRGGNGADALEYGSSLREGGGGGAGGGSICAFGGDGTRGSGGSAPFNATGGSGFRGNPKIPLLIDASDVFLSSSFDCSGGDGSNGTVLSGSINAGGGGGGGAAGGIIFVRGNNITLLSAITYNCKGGDGGDGFEAVTAPHPDNGGGGGGGGGGLVLIYYRDTYNNPLNLTTNISGGIKGVNASSYTGNQDGDEGYVVVTQINEKSVIGFTTTTDDTTGRIFNDIIGRY